MARQQGERFEVMAAVHPGGDREAKPVWVKVGNAWRAEEGKSYVVRVSLLALPVGCQAPVDLFLYRPKNNPEEAVPPGDEPKP